MNLFALQACARHVNESKDYDAQLYPSMVSLVAAALLHHFWDESGEWSGPRGKYIMSQGAQAGIDDGVKVAKLLGVDAEDIWLCLREFCRRRDLLVPEVCVVLYTHEENSSSSTLQAVVLIEACGQQLMTMLAKDLQVILQGGDGKGIYPFEWLKKARSLIYCMEHIMYHEPGRFHQYRHVFSMVIIQVIMCSLGLCIARSDFVHVQHTIDRLNDLKLEHYYHSEGAHDKNAGHKETSLPDLLLELQHVSKILAQTSLGVYKTTKIELHNSLPLVFLEIFVVRLFLLMVFDIMHDSNFSEVP